MRKLSETENVAIVTCVGLSRAFKVGPAGHLEISKITIEDGFAASDDDDGHGGALLVDGGLLTMRESVIRGSLASGSGGICPAIFSVLA